MNLQKVQQLAENNNSSRPGVKAAPNPTPAQKKGPLGVPLPAGFPVPPLAGRRPDLGLMFKFLS